MKSALKCDARVWENGDSGSLGGVISAAALLLFAIFVMPDLARRFLGDRLTIPDIMLFSAMPGIIAYRFFCAEKIPLKRLARSEIFEIILFAFALILLTGGVTWLWRFLLKLAGANYAEKQFAMQLIGQCHGRQRIQLFFSLCLFAPIMEELLFRRIIYGSLVRFGAGFAWFGTALLFSTCHFFIAGLPGLFILALGFQFAYLKYRNLTAAILLHALVNAVSFASVLMKVE